MRKVPFLLASILLSIPGQAADRVNIAEDEASHSAYNNGWNQDQNSGSGFGAWVLRSKAGTGEYTHSGFFIAGANDDNRIANIASGGKAFGLFANGVELEAAVAFRTLNTPLQVGDSFSVLLKCEDFLPKFENDDPQPGAIGFALRNGANAESWDEYQAGARMQFGFYQGDANYQIQDGEPDTDTGVPMTPAGIAVTVTLVTPDTYDLEITPLDTRETKRLTGRRLGGDAGTTIDSFALFNVDGESRDAFFNGLQVSRSGEAIGR
ncbi:MAG: hypothetical protein SFU53_04615 [Terrimicrobiaceae bacterium]|nr:hypothetical protein [Terrimicrobiaceae bacterium]